MYFVNFEYYHAKKEVVPRKGLEPPLSYREADFKFVDGIVFTFLFC